MDTVMSDMGTPGEPQPLGRAEPFRIEEERPAGQEVVLLALHGEVDLHVAPELRDRLTNAIEDGAEFVVLDLSRVTFMDSMALGVLLGALKRLKPRGGELRLIVPGAELRRIFEITLLDQVFTLNETRHEALAAFMDPWG
jgi:anti-sigma B factor antagonist